MPPSWVLASRNPGKAREFSRLLAGTGIRVEPLFAAGEPVAEENGSTYLENARAKAHAVARRLRRPALADDSGIELDALDGRPGIYSARWAGEDPWHNTREVLLALMEVPRPARGAALRAAVVLAWPDGRELAGEGTLRGVILGWPRGQGGFGVDPIFSLDGRTSLAEMDPAEKDAVGHRGQALRALLAAWEAAGRPE
ncbi:deoxyinosine/deoxyxanthosine triphosphate pyrophosphatase, promiscuous (subunit A) [Candidatus Hydrogenisulfobacillus filiaventi]|uniref:dITP/XTP pyrophosphatase n=1 Tax=Candidatus Hydrogenisulfobacillus filiaventi TaxID=2707344 RepID=A0A6F8ZI89_9FIRM|nr:deoxyinosine/deoxyxanthosine triphosphate pyrophosphatase, promiscuous (subunit A) [Candidatus Hydrogenisulfobacillus filiaventi]